MAKKTINLGTPPSGVGGDTARAAFEKVNSNFDELYAADEAIRGELSGKADEGAVNTALATKQPKDATLTALAALVTAANKLVYATGEDQFDTTDLTVFARSLLGDANAAAVRGRLGLKSGALADILGTVSQSNGVPTGAIIERGSNANGDYVRFADGTQICWIKRLPIGYVSSYRLVGTWVFPAQFSDSAIVGAGGLSGTNAADMSDSARNKGDFMFTAETTQQGLAGFMSNAAFVSGESGHVQITAIGRWY